MEKLVIAGREFSSRLFLGTGKFNSNEVMEQAILASGTEMVTVAMKRIDMDNKEDDMLKHIIHPNIQLLPNTSGVRNAEEAVFAAQLAREAFGTNWLKLEIHPDPRYLLPDSIETLKATEELVKLGFIVLPYCQADPVLCKRLEEAGAATVMPLGAPIGTNKGLQTKEFLQIIIEQAGIPVVVDAGIGSPRPRKYIFSFFGIVDLLATLPLYIGLLFPGARYLLIIRAFRLIRVFRVFKLFNFLNEGERLLTALRESSKKIAVFFLFVVILVTSIGTLMYMIEGTQPNSQFNNIPNSIYWAIVTMTTVGYGDITPVTGFGKFLSACVMLIGYTIIAVPTGIVSASMMKDYKRRRDKECPNCHRSGHEDNAEFCKYCGHHLNPSETDVEKK